MPAMEWIIAPGNEKVTMRYANAMKAQESMRPGEAVLLGDPSGLGFALCVLIMDEMVRVPLGVVTPDARIVDVGGGVGGAMMSLYKSFPHLRFAVQDTAKMVEIGHQVRDAFFVICPCTDQPGQIWNEQSQNVITSSRVMLQGD